jgi:glycosyltransferase involved in cell wall biosynthesis
MKGFSIIVCCYNSEQVLPETLAHIAALILPGGVKTELIIVDNCCTDDTVSTAKKIWSEYHAPIEMKIVYESTPGLSAAREKGIQTSCYEYLLFCDDDNRLAPDYLLTAERILSGDDRIGMLGGLGIPAYIHVPAYWPEDFYIYGSGPQAKESGTTHTVHGAGVLLRRAAFNRLKEAGFGFILSDRKGDKLTSGGDYELCFAIALAGYSIYYYEGLRFSHFIPEERMTWKYCYRFIRESAPAVNVLNVYHFVLTADDKKMINFYLRQMRSVLHHIKKIFYSSFVKYRYYHDEKIRFLETFHIEYHMARLSSICRDTFRFSQYLRKVNQLKSRLALHTLPAGQEVLSQA